jgi:hypothetical protein
MLNDTHIVIFSKLSQEKIDTILKKEIDYINELKIKKVEDPISINANIDISKLTRYSFLVKDYSNFVFYLTLCALNWMVIEYAVVKNQLYINKQDLDRSTINRIDAFVRGRSLKI